MTMARKRSATDAELKGCSFKSQVEITQDDINTIKNQSEDLQALAMRNVATTTSMLLKIDVLQTENLGLQEKSDMLQNEKSELHEKLKTQEEITHQLQKENCKLHEEMKILQEDCDKFRDVLSESLMKFKAVCTPASTKPTAMASCPSTPQTPALNISSQSTSKGGSEVLEGVTGATRRGRLRLPVLKVKRTQ